MKPWGWNQIGLGSFSWSGHEAENQNKPDLISLSLGVNNECNYKCAYCIYNNLADQNNDPIPEELFLQRLSELGNLQKIKIWGTAFARKEPLLPGSQEFLLKAIKVAKTFSRRVIIMTNAYYLTPDLAEKLSGSVDYLDPSLDCLYPCAYSSKSLLDESGIPTPAWRNTLQAIKSRQFEKVGIITTLNSRTTKKMLVEFLDRMAEDIGGRDNAVNCFQFYQGQTKDPLLVSQGQFLHFAETILQHPIDPRPQLTITDSIPDEWLAGLSLDPRSLRFCSETGVPSFLKEGCKIITLKQSVWPDNNHCLLGVEYDGLVYQSCEYLVLLKANPLGDLKKQSLAEIIGNYVK